MGHRPMMTFSFMVILPLLLHISITMVMKNILVRSLDQIPYELWIFPGIILIIASMSTFSMIYRDLFDLRIHKKSFLPMTLAPYSKTQLILGFLITSIVETTAYVIVAMAVLTVFLPSPFDVSTYFIILIFTFLYTFIVGNIIITFSVVTDRISIYLSILITMFLIILFGTGILVEFEFYPKTISVILSNFPLSMFLSSLREIIFFNRIDWFQIFIPIIVAIGWTWVNGYLLKKKLNQ
jgi:ABC-type polysaccharide/polyol phosphate export permease|tara:strand:- start:461 stop:1174 length:714 start_codon:yes stop_codon:yes gene_type:complete